MNVIANWETAFTIFIHFTIYRNCFSVAQLVEHNACNANVMGSISIMYMY